MLAVEYLIVGTAYLYELARPGGYASRGWRAEALWTIVLAAFVWYPFVFERPLVKRGRQDLFVAGHLLIAGYATWLAHLGFVPSFLFYIVVCEAIILDRRLGVQAGVVAAIVGYAERSR